MTEIIHKISSTIFWCLIVFFFCVLLFQGIISFVQSYPTFWIILSFAIIFSVLIAEATEDRSNEQR